MDKYLLNNVLTFRVPTVTDALALRDELSNLPLGDLVNFSYTTKYIKKYLTQKGDDVNKCIIMLHMD